MDVSLFHPSAGTLQLPWPNHEQRLESFSNQIVHRSASGLVITTKNGPTYYQITRVFGDLSDEEVDQLNAFWRAVGEAAGVVDYQYVPTGETEARSVPCRMIEPPQATRVLRDVWDVTLVFEQLVHPNRHGDTILAAPTNLEAEPQPD